MGDVGLIWGVDARVVGAGVGGRGVVGGDVGLIWGVSARGIGGWGWG